MRGRNSKRDIRGDSPHQFAKRHPSVPGPQSRQFFGAPLGLLGLPKRSGPSLPRLYSTDYTFPHQMYDTPAAAVAVAVAAAAAAAAANSTGNTRSRCSTLPPDPASTRNARESPRELLPPVMV
ncbi:hypothetical protein KQX54_005053 [Cotesia glomerata]|uniref:Uncharacterized protein n=1 Tax=Cotesia glomerata TaxID=32391 RepID=A0AAV7J6R8_COTGL|nr:hypothetical protein KQX54_005053 [Cotesia glomerata]